MSSIVQEHTLAELTQERRATALGLLWGGVLMVLLALWLPAKHEDLPGVLPILAWILAVLALGAALSQGLARPQGTPEEQRQRLLAGRRPVGGVLIVGGMVLLLISVLLASWYRLAAFGEAAGALLLGLVALAAGLIRLRPVDPSPGHTRFLQFLLQHRDLLALGLFVLAALLLLAAGIFGIRVHGWAGFPEWGGAILVALIALGGGIWLRAGAGYTVTLEQMRLFVLACGSLTGLVIAVMAILRGYTLGGDFFRGPSGWSGANAWQLWLVVYTAMIGLALMFGSLSLAQTEIRVNALLRRLLYGYNAVLNGLLLLTILTVLNVVVYASYPYTANWSRTSGLIDLSPNSKVLLSNLREPTKIYVLLSPNSPEYQDVKILLDNAQAYTDRLQVVYLSPDRDQVRYGELIRDYPELARDTKMERGMFDRSGGRGVLVVYGPETRKGEAKVPHSFLSASNLSEVKRDFQAKGKGGRETVLFKGEQAIMTELQFLMENKKKPKVYFLQGRSGQFLDMKDLEPGSDPLQGGAGMFVDRLKKDNYEARGLSFLPPPPRTGPDDPVVYITPTPDGKAEVPADAKVVVIASPKGEPDKIALDALDRFMDRGGKLVALIDFESTRIDPRSPEIRPTGWEEWLKKYSADVTNDFLIRFTRSQREDPREMPVEPAPGGNPIARGFRGAKKVFHPVLVRVVRPQTAPGGAYQAEALLQVPVQDEQVFTTSNAIDLFRPLAFLQRLANRPDLAAKRLETPPAVGVAVTDKDQKPRLVVTGTGLFITNYYMQAPTSGAYDLNVAFLEWLAERPSGLSIQPKTTGTYAIDPEFNRTQVIFLPAWLMIVGIIGLGTGIWIVRRR
jgi:hypothetical protein